MPSWLSNWLKSALKVLLGTLFLPSVSFAGGGEEIPPGAIEHFEREIRPLLAQRCYSCHSSRAEQIESGLRLDYRDGIRIGGDRGPAVTPGDPENSLLLRAVNGTDPDLSMPPGETLSTAEIQSLAQWIRTGAHDPRDEPIEPVDSENETDKEINFENSREHWAFREVLNPSVPEVQAVDRVRDPIDAFILHELEQNNLTLAPQASLSVLAQRAHQMLTGLPLSWERLQQLLASEDPDSFDRFIDELLDSSTFGERWARSWLDLARYADSNGLDENLAFGESWRYRDYVIRSLNEDKPYDQFLIEQIAGDLLPDPGNPEAWRDQRTATAFLTLGPKMLAEQDELKLAIDVVDEQLDVASRAFLAMTVGCARCHDHKFDPISARDYYAMAGIFRSTSTMENLKTVARWREISLETEEQGQVRKDWENQRAELTKQLDSQKKKVRADLEEVLPTAVGQHLLAAEKAIDQISISGVTETASTTLGENRSNYGSKEIPVLHSVKSGIQQATWKLKVPAAGLWSIDVRYAAQEKRPMRLLVDGEVISEEVLKTVTGGWTLTHQFWESQAEIQLEAGEVEIRLERQGVVPHLDRIRLVPAAGWPDAETPLVVSGWVDFLTRPTHQDDSLWSHWLDFCRQQLADGDEISSWWEQKITAESISTLPEAVRNLFIDSSPSSRIEIADIFQKLVIAAEAKGDSKIEALQPIVTQLRSTAGPWFEPLALAEQAAPAELRGPIVKLEADLAAHDGHKPPPPEMTLGVRDGDVADLPIHIRGSHLRLAKDPVPRGALEVTEHLVPAIDLEEGNSGRLELARWMAHPDHPLTSRVAVNRIWMELFGNALVSTPSNFGLRGDRPSHPELLDHLANEFVSSGWSIKKMVRRIMNTSTWRQQVIEDSLAEEFDPENRLLWRQNRHRLRAEAVRDSVLEVSGTLDKEMGGTLLMTANRGYVTNDQSNNQARYDVPRRSIYLPVIRNAMYELFSAFDYNDPSAPISKRYSTVVPHQALFFLNSPMVLESALEIAREAMAEFENVKERVQEVHRRILCREATDSEVERAIRFINNVRDFMRTEDGEEARADSVESEESAWQAYAQALISSSEFLYLD